MIFSNLIQTNLRTKHFGKEVEYYQRLDSTNVEAWDLIKSGEATNGMIIITDNQIKGKGRNGNSWFMAPSKGLAMSIILNQKLSIEEAELIPIAVGVSIAKAIENRGAKPQLKWPNDIFIDGKKCGGVLCESKVSSNFIHSMVIGIGLNINETETDFPEPLRDKSTSLSIATGHSNQRELVCAIITTFFERAMEDLKTNIKLWENYCSHMDDLVSFNHGNSKNKGTFKGINQHGHAMIDIKDEVHVFPSIRLK